jgi:hypothetical protein
MRMGLRDGLPALRMIKVLRRSSAAYVWMVTSFGPRRIFCHSSSARS